MEGVGKTEFLEVAPEPDLYEAYKLEQIARLGITVGDLGDLCPIDFNDPKYSVAEKNARVVNIINKEGLAIEPAHESVFEKHLAASGAERRFILAEKNTNKTERTHRETSPADKVAPINEKVKVQKVAEQGPPASVSSEIVTAWHRQEEQVQKHIHKQEHVTPAAEVEIMYQAVSEPLSVKPVTIREQSPTPHVQDAAPQQTLHGSAHTKEIKAVGVTHDELSTDYRHFIEAADRYQNDVLAERLVSSIDENEMFTPQPEANWQAELQKSPELMIVDFTQALDLLVTTALAQELGDSTDNTEASEPLPAIINEVALRLTELSTGNQQDLAPTITSIVGALHGIELLIKTEAAPEMVMAAGAQLESLCVSLLDALDVTYTKQELHEFMETLLSPQLKQALLTVMDIEKIGTRERKLFGKKVIIWPAQRSLHSLIGWLAVISLQPRLAAR